MAGVITTTSVVQITVYDEQGKLKSFNIDNPKQNLTLNTIQTALQPAFNGRWWLGNTGSVITGIEKAIYSTAEKVPIGGSAIVVTVTPNSLTMSMPTTAGGKTQGSVVVEGAPIQSAYVQVDEGVNPIYIPSVNINGETVTVTILQQSGSSAGNNLSGYLVIYVNNQKIDIPINKN